LLVFAAQATFTVTKADDAVNAYFIQCEGIGFANPHFQTAPTSAVPASSASSSSSSSSSSSQATMDEEGEEEAQEMSQ
jgi:hypothetical protein